VHPLWPDQSTHGSVRGAPFRPSLTGWSTGWRSGENRPLDPVYPVVFIDAIRVKIRDGNVVNRPIYLALGVTVDGERDILGVVGR
jgi:hypothetical protein